MKGYIFLLTALATVGLQTSCYPVRAYKTGTPVVKLRENENITLGYIEFDDNGELFDRNELDQTIHQVYTLHQNSPDTGINVFVFIHGWKNNASDEANNVAGFQDFLKTIYAHYSDEYKGTAKQGKMAPLMGIYIGWRGASLRVAKDLTYWNRSPAAQRAGSIHMDEAIHRIILATRQPQPKGTKLVTSEAPRSNLVIIGHSFGGRVLEHVMTPYILDQILQSDHDADHKCHSGTPMPVDSLLLPTLTILLNEAAPATDAKQFLEFLQCHDIEYGTCSKGKDCPKEDQRPLFLSVTSDGDAANEIGTPIGQTLARLQMKTRAYEKPDPPAITNQSTYFTHTAAFIPALRSHEFTLKPCDSPPSPGSIRIRTDPCYDFSPIAKAWNGTPYWIALMPNKIVPNHTDIFQAQFVNFVESFLPPSELSQPKMRSRPTLSIR